MTRIVKRLRHSRDKAQGIGSNSKALKYLNQDYEELKRSCFERRRLFEDEYFGAEPSSLGFKELGPFKKRGITWLRPKELHSRPKFIVENATRTDICQGALVQIRNPWGKVEWNGAWSDKSCEWRYVSDHDREQLTNRCEDGEFWMSFSDFLRKYSRLEIWNLTPDALSNDKYKNWAETEFEETWRRGVSAGGCRNNPDSFWRNPQFVIKLEDVDNDPYDGENVCTFIVGLMQKNRRKIRKMGEDFETIGFAVYELPKEFSGQKQVHLKKEFFLYNKFVCSLRNLHKFARGFQSHHSSSGEIDDPVACHVEPIYIDEDDVDDRFRGVFEQLAGHDVEICVFELQRILNRVVAKKDNLKTDGFGLATCRTMVNMLDKDGSGKLGLVEFKILWTKIEKYVDLYLEIDADKSGCMSSSEMRSVVEAADWRLFTPQPGFQLNNPLHQIIVAHCDSNLTIDFDNFVGCLFCMELLFNTFKALDKDSSGCIDLDFMQWLELTIEKIWMTRI